MRKGASVSLQQLRACLRAHERLLDEDWPEAAWSSASGSEDEEENRRQAYRRLNPKAGEPLKEHNTLDLESSQSSELCVKAEPAHHRNSIAELSDRRRVDAEHWAHPAQSAMQREAHHAILPHQHDPDVITFSKAIAEPQSHGGACFATDAVEVLFSSHGWNKSYCDMHHSTSKQLDAAFPTNHNRPHSSLACVNVDSRNPSPDLISEPEIHQLDDDINSVKALLQEQEAALPPINTGTSQQTYHSVQTSPSISPATSLYQKSSRTRVLGVNLKDVTVQVPHQRSRRAGAAQATASRSRAARARTASPLRKFSQGGDAHIYAVAPTQRTSTETRPTGLQRCEAERLQAKLQSAELRAVGLGETIKVLETSLKDKQAALIHAKQRTPTKQSKPVTPTKPAPNLKHLMASRKLEKDLKKRVSDLQEDLAAARAAMGAEKERSSALGESVRRAQQARREAEAERLRAASAADLVREKVSGLAARVKTLQRQLEDEQRSRLDAEGAVKALKQDLERERAQRTDATTELSRCAPRIQELQIVLDDQRREAEEASVHLQDAKGQIQSLGVALRDTRKMYAECAHDNSLLKAALTSTQQGVKAMHSIVQQQQFVRAASSGTAATASAPAAALAHDVLHSTTQHTHMGIDRVNSVSGTAAATPAPSFDISAGTWQPGLAKGVTAACALDAVDPVARRVPGDTPGGPDQLHTFATVATGDCGTAPVSAWWPRNASAASHTQEQQLTKQHPCSVRPVHTIHAAVRGGSAAMHSFSGVAPRMPDGAEGALAASRHPNTEVAATQSPGRGDGVQAAAAHDVWEGVKHGGHAWSESADSDQLSFDQEVQDIIHRGALITADVT